MNSICDFLVGMFKSSQHSDIEMELWDSFGRSRVKTYRLHRLILMQCTYFESLIAKGFKENRMERVIFWMDMRDYSVDLLENFFGLFYIQDYKSSTVRDEDLLATYHLCVVMNFERGRVMCLEKMRCMLEGNMLQILDYATEYGTKDLSSMCTNWIDTLGKIHSSSEEWREKIPPRLSDSSLKGDELSVEFSLAISLSDDYSKRWSERVKEVSYGGSNWVFYLHRDSDAMIWNLGIIVHRGRGSITHTARFTLHTIGRTKRSNRVIDRDIRVNGVRQELKGVITVDDLEDAFKAGKDFSIEPDMIGAGHFIGRLPALDDLCVFVRLEVELDVGIMASEVMNCE